MALNVEQQQKIDNNRLAERPKYFDSASEQEQTISLDFEGYLILLEDSKRDEIITNLQKSLEDNENSKDRDEIIAIAIDNEFISATTQFDALNTEIEEFATFRNNLSIENFETVNEVGLLLSDLQRALGEDLLYFDRMQHLITYQTVLRANFNNGKVDDNTVKQVESWIAVVTEYKGI